MIDTIKALWDNVAEGATKIKDIVFAFIDIVNMIFSFIPSPFKEILIIALTVVIALVAVKIINMIRGA